jgi:hypothetical protein
MAAEDEDEIRRRQREREDEREAQEREERQKKTSRGGSRGGGDLSTQREALSEKLEDLLLRAEPLLEQVNHLYSIYLAGAEQYPPIERRKTLDGLMVSLQMISKPTPAALYKYTAIAARYESYRNRWDKLLRDLENGKIQRRGPASGSPRKPGGGRSGSQGF